MKVLIPPRFRPNLCIICLMICFSANSTNLEIPFLNMSSNLPEYDICQITQGYIIPAGQSTYDKSFNKFYHEGFSLTKESMITLNYGRPVLTIGVYKNLSPLQVNFILIVLILFTSILSLILFKRYNFKKRLLEHVQYDNQLMLNKLKELESSNRAKQKFLTIISHDLINPFNVMMGYSTLLKEEYSKISDGERKKFINAICKQVRSNYNLVKRLLNWVNIQENKIVLKKELINDVKPLIDDAISPHVLYAETKNISISNNINEDNQVAYFDKNILILTISNLINNAIKFTHKGGRVNIFNRLENEMMQICVQDNGVGFSKRQLKNIFSNDKRESTLGTFNEQGSGMGLKICKDLLTFHKGNILIESEKDLGTTVTISIPIDH